MIDKKSTAYQRPYSIESAQRVDDLIQAITTLRVEAYRAHASEHPALDKALYYLAAKLVGALKQENPHVLKAVRYEEESCIMSPTTPPCPICLCGAPLGPDGLCEIPDCVCRPEEEATA